MTENQLTPNRQYKDRLFRFLFQDKRDLLSLYNAVNGSSYENPDDLEIHTLDDALYISMKNDISFLIDNRMNLYEEQSSWNPNMPLRGLFYFSRLYAGYIAAKQLDIYTDSKIKLPLPQFIVFFIGKDRKYERTTLRLSDSFPTIDGVTPCLECTADVINIRTGYNEQLIKSCNKLYEYSVLVCTIQDFRSKGYSLRQSIDMAIELCLQQGILIDFLVRYRSEVTDMILWEYNEELHQKTLTENAINRINLLYEKLMNLNRMDDMKRAMHDPEFRDQLFEELNIWDEI